MNHGHHLVHVDQWFALPATPEVQLQYYVARREGHSSQLVTDRDGVHAFICGAHVTAWKDHKKDAPETLLTSRVCRSRLD